MANTIQLKRSSVSGAVPSAASLTEGELALNTADGKVFAKKTDGTVVEIGGGGAGGISTGTIVRAASRNALSGEYLPCGGQTVNASTYPNLVPLLPKYYAPSAPYFGMSAVSNYQDIAYGDGTYVVITYGSSVVWTSPDGIVWTQRAMPASRNWISLDVASFVEYQGGGVYVNVTRFVAVATGTNIIAYSDNYGVTWTEATFGWNTAFNAGWSKLRWVLNRFEICQTATNNNLHMVSGDGKYFDPTSLPEQVSWQNFCSFGNKAVILSNGSRAGYRTATTGWTTYGLPVSANWSNVATDGSRFVAVSNGNKYCMVSEDGLNWEVGYMPRSLAYQHLIYADGEFYVTGNTNYFYNSRDGLNWQENTFAQSRNTKVSYWNGTSYNVLGYGTSNTIAGGRATPDSNYIKMPWFDNEQRTPFIKA